MAGYAFDTDLGVNIILDITEARGLVRKREEWGWPLFWRGSVEDTLTDCEAKSLKLFQISASYGLTGWVSAAAAQEELEAMSSPERQ